MALDDEAGERGGVQGGVPPGVVSPAWLWSEATGESGGWESTGQSGGTWSAAEAATVDGNAGGGERGGVAANSGSEPDLTGIMPNLARVLA